jgi:NitT/TauT family transport system substrate-binding protein
VTTVLVARAKFLADKRDLVKRFVAGHKELTQWIKQNPEHAQSMARAELRASFRIDLPAELVAHAWPRMVLTSDAPLAGFQDFVAKAKQVGFMRTVPDLSALIETP